MKLQLHRRLIALERQPTSEPVTLIMPDGRTETLRGDCIFELLSGACRGERTPTLELLAQSVGSTEPGGGHLLELARAILNSPVDEAGTITPQPDLANAARWRPAVGTALPPFGSERGAI